MFYAYMPYFIWIDLFCRMWGENPHIGRIFNFIILESLHMRSHRPLQQHYKLRRCCFLDPYIAVLNSGSLYDFLKYLFSASARSLSATLAVAELLFPRTTVNIDLYPWRSNLTPINGQVEPARQISRSKIIQFERYWADTDTHTGLTALCGPLKLSVNNYVCKCCR